MSVFDNIGRFGAALRNARRNRQAVRYLNALPPEMQKDIGWPSDGSSRPVTHYGRTYWDTLI